MAKIKIEDLPPPPPAPTPVVGQDPQQTPKMPIQSGIRAGRPGRGVRA